MLLQFDTFHIIFALLLTSLFVWLLFVSYKKWQSYFSYKESRNYTFQKPLFYTLILWSFLSMILSFFWPAWTSENMNSTSWSDIIFTIDVSRSMDTEDIDDGNAKISRLTMAKKIIENEIGNHPENHYWAIAFAGQALIISPLTNDANIFTNLVWNLNSGLIQEGGTNITDAIKLALKRFSGSTKNDTPKSIVILTDGEDIENSINMDAIKKELQDTKNISLNIVGIGTENGWPIPMWRDLFGNPIYKMYQWETIISRLWTSTIKSLANIFWTSMQYVDSSNQSNILKNIATTETSRIYLSKNLAITDKSQYFIALSWLLYFGSLLIIRRR